MKRRRWTTMALALAIGGLALICGVAGDIATSRHAINDAHVTIAADALSPAAITVTVGTEVTWHNASGQTVRLSSEAFVDAGTTLFLPLVAGTSGPVTVAFGHSLLPAAPQGTTKPIEPGGQFTHTYQAAGIFHYFVTPQAGMTGTVNVGAAATPVPTTTPTSTLTCAPLKHQTYILDDSIGLRCNPTGARNTSAKIFDVPVLEKGFTLARATLIIHHTGITNITHFWNAHVAVGREEYAYQLGDDICMDSPPATKVNFGYGQLTKDKNRVIVYAFQGASPCLDNTIEVLGGSRLDLWIEDDRAECKGNNIEYASWYEEFGYTRTYDWETYMEPIVRRCINVTSDEGSLLMMSIVEGSPDLNPNRTCLQERATLASELRLNYPVIHQVIEPIPASTGLGHLVLYNEAQRTVARGLHLVELRVGANFSSSVVRTGGNRSGDAAVFIVKQ